MAAINRPIPVLLLLSCVSASAMAADAGAEAKGVPACEWCPDETGWSGWGEAGIRFQGDDDYRFGRYTGEIDSGARFDASGEVSYRELNGLFFEGRADHLGLDSGRMSVKGGRQGRYDLEWEYDEIPNYREREAYSPYAQQANGRLALPEDWVPGDSTRQMPTLGGALVRTPLESQRDSASVRVTLYPGIRWEISAYAQAEDKEGVRDPGAAFGFNQAVILPVPYVYETDEFGLSLGYNGDRLQTRLAYTGSLFKSGRNAVVWQNAFEGPASNTAWGQMAEAPDNEFHQISALAGYQLRDDTRLSARFARGRMTQDEKLLPYTINPAIQTSALPADNADAEVDTTLAAVEINSRPTRRLRLDASYTYSDRDNNTPINTYDYVITDLGAGGERSNRPYGFEQSLFRLKGAYRFPNQMRLSAGYDNDQMDRTYTAVEETHEKTAWAELKLRPWGSLEAKLKYAYSDRDASPYVPLAEIDPLLDNPHDNFYNNPAMRVLHYADRKRDKPGLALSYFPAPELSLGLDLDYYEDEYAGAHLGLQEAAGLAYTLSASLALSESLTASAYFTRDQLSSTQSGSEKMFFDQPGDPWLMSDRYDTRTTGLGVLWTAVADKLDLGADLTYSDYTGSMSFANGDNLPDLSSTLAAADLHATYHWSDALSFRFQLRYEGYDENDWAENGYVNADPTLLSLGAAPLDNSNLAGYLTLRYEFPVKAKDDLDLDF